MNLASSVFSAAVLSALTLASCSLFESGPNVVGEEISYTAADGTTCKGYIAYDTNAEASHPGVLVVHEWWGHNDYVRRRADMLASLGYTALALDMYGDGKATEHPSEANAFMSQALSDMDGGVAKFNAARRVLETHASTDPTKTAAIGYCFGGGVVLHMARVGADLDGVASFHGSLGSSTPEPVTPQDVKAAVLVCTGQEDQMVKDDQIEGLQSEFGWHLELHEYPGAQHGFTNPAADAMAAEHAGLPIGYNASADAQSWKALEAFLVRVFE